MSGPISIGSAAEWQSLLSGTSVVVADCKPSNPSCMKLTNTISLRRLVRPMQDDRTALRSSRQGALAPEESRIRQSQRRLAKYRCPHQRRQRYAYLQDLP